MRPLVTIDFSALDGLGHTSGQFRYGRSLIAGLAAAQTRFDFVVLGSRSQPITELQPIFAQPGWSYRQFQLSLGRGGYLLDPLRLAAGVRRSALVHALHKMVPVPRIGKTVWTCYDLIQDLLPEYAAIRASRRYRFFKWMAQRVVDHAICISQSTKSDLLGRWRIPDSAVSVIPIGISESLLGEGEAALPDGEKLIRGRAVLSVYNLEPRKNLHTLLRAFRDVLKELPSAHLFLYGRSAVNARRESDYEQLVREQGLGHAITRLGILSDQQVGGLHRKIGVFVFPSLYEGFGYPVVEAMANGCHVVAHDGSSMPELMAGFGTRVDMRDVSACAGAIRAGLAAAQRGPETQAAVAHARSFTCARMVEDTLRVYERVLGSAA